MDILRNCLIVGAGGALGTVCRYLLSLLPLRPQNGFPVVTLGINVAGAFCIGLIAALALRDENRDPVQLLFLKTGICGGFTTFSAFSLETAGLLQSGRYGVAASYILLSAGLCVGAVFGAQALIK